MEIGVMETKYKIAKKANEEKSSRRNKSKTDIVLLKDEIKQNKLQHEKIKEEKLKRNE